MEGQKYPQNEERNEYRYVDSWWLDQVATGLTAGGEEAPRRDVEKYPCRQTRGACYASLVALSAR